MKLFERDGKINFVDENNVVVGFDYVADCCEQFGWYLTDSEPTGFSDEESEIENPITDDMRFDPDYFKLIDPKHVDEPSIAVFRLIGNSTRYLVLHNTHNGYYAHGFSMEVGGILRQDGSL